MTSRDAESSQEARISQGIRELLSCYDGGWRREMREEKLLKYGWAAPEYGVPLR